jgi:hypothetical protein
MPLPAHRGFPVAPPSLQPRCAGLPLPPKSAATPEWVRELNELTRIIGDLRQAERSAAAHDKGQEFAASNA